MTWNIITPIQAQFLADANRSLIIDEMTPQEAVQITDAFKFTDFELGSVLGRYDGRVYEGLMEEVRRDPVNSDASLKEDILELIRGKWRQSSKL